MRPAEVSLMLKSVRLAAGNPMALKGPSQPPPFSMSSKLLILHGEVRSECLLQVVFLNVRLIILSIVICFVSTSSE